jgi:hypothetical protein
MLNTLLSSKPVFGLTSYIQTTPSFQSHNNLQLIALLIAIKVFLTCAVMFLAMLVIIVLLACALCAIVTKLSSDNPTERTVI